MYRRFDPKSVCAQSERHAGFHLQNDLAPKSSQQEMLLKGSSSERSQIFLKNDDQIGKIISLK